MSIQDKAAEQIDQLLDSRFPGPRPVQETLHVFAVELAALRRVLCGLLLAHGIPVAGEDSDSLLTAAEALAGLLEGRNKHANESKEVQ